MLSKKPIYKTAVSKYKLLVYGVQREGKATRGIVSLLFSLRLIKRRSEVIVFTGKRGERRKKKTRKRTQAIFRNIVYIYTPHRHSNTAMHSRWELRLKQKKLYLLPHLKQIADSFLFGSTRADSLAFFDKEYKWRYSLVL